MAKGMGGEFKPTDYKVQRLFVKIAVYQVQATKRAEK